MKLIPTMSVVVLRDFLRHIKPLVAGRSKPLLYLYMYSVESPGECN